VPESDYRVFVESQREPRMSERGKIIGKNGEVLGEHTGVYRYTIGQRHGLGIASPLPYYVKEIRPGSNEVVVGRRETLYSRKVEAESFNWLNGAPPQDISKAEAQIRYRHSAAPGRLEVVSPDKVIFVFDEPQWAVTPGQALVCYEGERLLGGGWIIG